jgi:translation initiation factor IF-2
MTRDVQESAAPAPTQERPRRPAPVTSRPSPQRTGNSAANGSPVRRPAGDAPSQRSAPANGGSAARATSSRPRTGSGTHVTSTTGSQSTGNRTGSGGAASRGRTGQGQTGRRPARNRAPVRTGPRPPSAAPKLQQPQGPIALPPQIVVKDLAEALGTSANEVIRALIKHNVFASINQMVDYETAALVGTDLGFTIQEAPPVAPSRPKVTKPEQPESTKHAHLVPRPPVVTVMGHVDHGKTSLLDAIRQTHVAAGEAGGITQHIGAYQVEINGKKITFLDTPGHEAFTAMRARGAQVTDIAIIVVAADDGVMPQTIEAIDHARAANVPIMVALNKIDKPGANEARVKQQLADHGVVIEEYGGDVVCVSVSAKRGTGIDELLEMILLVAEVQELRADPHRPAEGTIIEARMDKAAGPTATVLVQNGTLKLNDAVVVGAIPGRVRAMFNDTGKRIRKADPSMPVGILGLPEVPQAGDQLQVVADEKQARAIASKRGAAQRLENLQNRATSLENLFSQGQAGQPKELALIVKGDVQGSIEAIKHSLGRLSDGNLSVLVVHEGVGNISETDVHLAAASHAVIIGFNVKADPAAQRLAANDHVQLRFYDIIYKLVDDVQAALTGMLEPTYREVIEGHAQVLALFKVGRTTIAGSRVIDGKLTRSSQVRVFRQGQQIFDGKIASLRRGKDDVREVGAGFECGITFEDFNEVAVEDTIASYTRVRV